MASPEFSAMAANALAQSMTPETVELMLRLQAQYGTQEGAARLAQELAEGVTARLYS
jgi:hypothetical protein